MLSVSNRVFSLSTARSNFFFVKWKYSCKISWDFIVSSTGKKPSWISFSRNFLPPIKNYLILKSFFFFFFRCIAWQSELAKTQYHNIFATFYLSNCRKLYYLWMKNCFSLHFFKKLPPKKSLGGVFDDFVLLEIPLYLRDQKVTL